MYFRQISRIFNALVISIVIVIVIKVWCCLLMFVGQTCKTFELVAIYWLTATWVDSYPLA